MKIRRRTEARLLKNWPLKLISLFLALILWLILVPEDKAISEKTMTVPLEIRNIPVGLEMIERPTANVDINIKGPNRILKDAKSQEIRAVLDLEKATVYQQEFPVNPSSIYVPSGLTVTSVRPSKVNLKLDKTVEETLEIKPIVRGKTAAGYRIARVEVQPSKVMVRGPESRFKAKDMVTTAPVDATDLQQTTVFDVDIILPRADMRLLSIFTNVRVTVFMEPDTGAPSRTRTSTVRKK